MCPPVADKIRIIYTYVRRVARATEMIKIVVIIVVIKSSSLGQVRTGEADGLNSGKKIDSI